MLLNSVDYMHRKGKPNMSVRVLVAEDNVTLRWLFVQQLEKLGLQSDCAENGAEAIDRFKKNPNYALILMDVMMPEVDGLDATREIRRIEAKNRHVPIVSITAAPEKQKCFEAGMDDYYQKPVLPEHFEEIVSKWIKPMPAANIKSK
jgi:CheY-like chemotaxis protein